MSVPLSRRVLVLGGTGAFGTHLTRALARTPHIHILVASRNGGSPVANATPITLDRSDNKRFAQLLVSERIDLVADCSGPWQRADYSVARTVIESGCHYVSRFEKRVCASPHTTPGRPVR